MKIKQIEFKNFASYGNRVQKIDFTDSNGDLYLVLGNNGAGKSTLAKVITYLCYGKVDGSSLKDLPNRVNSSLWGKIIIESKGNEIEIERGINPGIFNVKINGSEYDVAGKSNMQEFLETEMYEIPYQVFKNVIILSVNDFKSFITMSPYDKKMIVDRIFGFSVINEMRDLVKQKRKGILDELRTFEDEIRTLGDSIKSVTKKLEQFEKDNQERSKEKVDKIKKSLEELKEKKNTLIDASNKAKEKIEKYDKLLREKSNEQSEVTHEIRTVKKALKLYESQTCPTCGGSLDTEFHQHIKTEKEDSLKEYAKKYLSIKEEVSDIDKTLSGLRDKGRKILSHTTQIDTNLDRLVKDLKDLMNNTPSDSAHLTELIQDFELKVGKKKEGKLRVEGEDYYLSVLENLMGDDGIKNLAIRSILPSFNNHILLMGKEMGIPFTIKFDEKFNCEIQHLGEAVSPKTLSTGERKKVDFVIIMALIKMIKVRFPSLNVLFLDEIFSSIDNDGVYHIISILHQTIQDVGLNTFVINHTVLPSEYFDKKIEITKDAGFSEFTIETIG